MKIYILIIAMLVAGEFIGQRKINPTDTLKITGKVKKEFAFALSDLDTFPVKMMTDVIITNQEGEIKNTIRGMKGILLLDILKHIELQADKPRAFNEFYFLFVASDGYKAVFSWNEIFNTEVGKNIYLVTEREGKKIREMGDRIAVIVTTDFKTGRRYIKGLEKIIALRAE